MPVRALKKKLSVLSTRPGVGEKTDSEKIISASKSSDIFPIDPVTQALAAKAAEEKTSILRESLPRTLVVHRDARDCLAPFLKEEIVLGPKLGTGEFSDVFEVSSFNYQQNLGKDHDLSLEELDKRLEMKRIERYRKTNKPRYALKHIKPEYHQENDAESYVQAASDLVLEKEILTWLEHPHIIKLRGIAQAGASGFEQGPGGYFLVIDRLEETLDQRIRRWRGPERKSRLMSSLNRSISSLSSIETLSKPFSDAKSKKVLDERLDIGLQISAALKYLHSHQIIFRDLKPYNNGFDVRGDVKLFDFGLARILSESGDGNHDTYEMSGAGTPRYMAPECLKGNAYNMKCDVYSFSVVLWEILAGQTPYAFIKKRSQFIHQVVYEDAQPSIDDNWPSAIKNMLESSFDSDICKRPTMVLWYKILREALVNLRGGDRTNLDDAHVSRRRSIESLDGI